MKGIEPNTSICDNILVTKYAGCKITVLGLGAATASAMVGSAMTIVARDVGLFVAPRSSRVGTAKSTRNGVAN